MIMLFLWEEIKYLKQKRGIHRQTAVYLPLFILAICAQVTATWEFRAAVVHITFIAWT